MSAYKAVFTDEDVTVGQADLVKMYIKLTENAIPVRALVW